MLRSRGRFGMDVEVGHEYGHEADEGHVVGDFGFGAPRGVAF